MTPEERAELILVSIESVQDRDYRLGFIEQSIRDAVAEANAKALAALEPFARLAEDIERQEREESYPYPDNWIAAQGFRNRKVYRGQLRAARDAYLALGGKL